jgi:hypothetical protein
MYPLFFYAHISRSLDATATGRFATDFADSDDSLALKRCSNERMLRLRVIS